MASHVVFSLTLVPYLHKVRGRHLNVFTGYLKSPALLNEQQQLLMLTDFLSKYRGSHESMLLESTGALQRERQKKKKTELKMQPMQMSSP